MKKLSKLVLSVAVASALASNAVAEESGGFLGLEVGASASLQEAKITGSIGNQSKTYSKDFDAYGFNAGIVAGYKVFFASWFGLRGYANLNYIHTFGIEEIGEETKTNGTQSETWKKYQDYTIGALNYGVNLDLLFNVLAFEEANLGLFAGVGLGANTFITQKAIDTAKKIVAQDADFANNVGDGFNDIKDKTYTGFDAWLNVGIRTNFLTHHEIEVLAKVPFVGTTAYDKKIGVANASANAKVKYYIPWNVNLRYIYSF